MADRSPLCIANRPTWGPRAYAIAFDLDADTSKRLCHNETWQNGHDDIRRVLTRQGFSRRQGSVSFGDASVDPVRCVLAIQAVAKECPWFRQAVNDVRTLRIEQINDLLPAIGDPELALDPGRKAAAPFAKSAPKV